MPKDYQTKQTQNIEKPFKGWLPFLGLVLGLIIGVSGASIYFQKHPVILTDQSLREGEQDLINPLLAIDLPDGTTQDEYKSLESKVNNTISQAESQGKVIDVSVYFKGPNAEWFDIGAEKEYDPGSLLKIPVMIAYLKLAENNPDILTQTITYNQVEDMNAMETIKPAYSMVSGKTYTVNQLIDLMIQYSDNNAAILLSSLLQPDYLNEVYTDLGLDVPPNQGTQISPKEYSIFFKILYNATYLDKTASEQALELLTKTDFNAGLVAGVPDSIKVAHKFGESGNTDSQGVPYRELHDCGFVYYPKDPYLLCIMTRGRTIADLENLIQSISKEVYTDVNAHH